MKISADTRRQCNRWAYASLFWSPVLHSPTVNVWPFMARMGTALVAIWIGFALHDYVNREAKS